MSISHSIADISAAFRSACKLGEVAAVRWLLAQADLDPNGRDGSGETGLTLACKEGRKETVDLLLSDPRVDVNTKNGDGRTALMAACEGEWHSIVDALLDDGRADINALDAKGQNALYYVLVGSTYERQWDPQSAIATALRLLRQPGSMDLRSFVDPHGDIKVQFGDVTALKKVVTGFNMLALSTLTFMANPFVPIAVAGMYYMQRKSENAFKRVCDTIHNRIRQDDWILYWNRARRQEYEPLDPMDSALVSEGDVSSAEGAVVGSGQVIGLESQRLRIVVVPRDNLKVATVAGNATELALEEQQSRDLYSFLDQAMGLLPAVLSGRAVKGLYTVTLSTKNVAQPLASAVGGGMRAYVTNPETRRIAEHAVLFEASSIMASLPTLALSAASVITAQVHLQHIKEQLETISHRLSNIEQGIDAITEGMLSEQRGKVLAAINSIRNWYLDPQQSVFHIAERESCRRIDEVIETMKGQSATSSKQVFERNFQPNKKDLSEASAGIMKGIRQFNSRMSLWKLALQAKIVWVAKACEQANNVARSTWRDELEVEIASFKQKLASNIRDLHMKTFKFAAVGATEGENAQSREAIRQTISAIDRAEDLPDSLDQLEQQIAVTVEVTEDGSVGSVKLLDQTPDSDLSWESVFGMSLDERVDDRLPVSRPEEEINV